MTFQRKYPGDNSKFPHAPSPLCLPGTAERSTAGLPSSIWFGPVLLPFRSSHELGCVSPFPSRSTEGRKSDLSLGRYPLTQRVGFVVVALGLAVQRSYLYGNDRPQSDFLLSHWLVWWMVHGLLAELPRNGDLLLAPLLTSSRPCLLALSCTGVSCSGYLLPWSASWIKSMALPVTWWEEPVLPMYFQNCGHVLLKHWHFLGKEIRSGLA